MPFNEFWLISVPGDPTPQDSWDKLWTATQSPTCHSLNFKFDIPSLKVGTLDQLVSISDDLERLDTYCESVARKIANYFSEVLDHQRDKLAENLVVGNNMDIISYVTKFHWDYAKFPIRLPLKSLEEMLSKQINRIESELKSKSNSFNQLKQSISAAERKQTGSLLTKDLSGVIKKEHFVLGSEYLITLFVCVPKSHYKEWNAKYESLCSMVVPRSSQLICEDEEYGLFSVTIFRKVEDTFRYKCRENKFVVRNFTYDDENFEADKNLLKKLEAEKTQQFGPLVRWLKINFSEAFTNWIHVKTLRVFVESVLRYGLPVNFIAIVLQPQGKSTKKLSGILNELYSSLDISSTSKAPIESDDTGGLSYLEKDYRPYVFFKMNLEFTDPTVK